MSDAPQPDQRFIVVSTNFGGPRTAAAMQGHPLSRPAALAQVICDPDRTRSDLPTIAALQEMSRLLQPSNDSPTKTLQELAPLAPQSFYAPAVSTDRYPLPLKWAAPGLENVRQIEQGMTTITVRGAYLFAPHIEPGHTGLVLDLPIVQFVSDPPDSIPSPVQSTTLPSSDHSPQAQLRFRHTHYRGTRDTEPRIATAHRVRLGVSPDAELIFLNLHLATLLEENTRGYLRVQRTPTQHATALRFLQLDLLAHYIDDVYRNLRLPVVVAGDFNTRPDAPDLSWFCQRARLDKTFATDGGHCWKCGEPVPNEPQINLYTAAGCNSILTTDPDEFRAAGHSNPEPVAVSEWCPRCAVPLFTHKRNFSLIDNILYTSPDAARDLQLRSAIDPTNERGIRADTYFSDHLPIWATFRLATPPHPTAVS